ncbi:MAG: tetratricopeptide repeat protein [Opitutales bacterium]
MSIFARRFFELWILVGVSSVLWATPLVEGEDVLISSEPTADLLKEALELGLPEADAFLAAELEKEGLSELDRVSLLVERMALAIQLNDWTKAAAISEEFPEDGPLQTVRRLLSAMLWWGERDVAEAQKLLGEIEGWRLGARWRAWYWVLDGMISEHRNELAKSAESYDKALEHAREDQLPFLELLVERNKILIDGSSEGVETDLLIRMREFSGEAIAHQFAEQLMFSYVRRGAYDEALALLEERRAFILLPRDQNYLDKFRLFEALVLEESGQENVAALVQLLGSGQTPRVLRQGLEMLLAQKEALPADVDLAALLTRWSEQLPVHPIQVDILNGLAVLALVEERFPLARQAAEVIIEEYPGSEKVASAMQILAWADWDEGAYRSAAVWFEKLRNLEARGSEKALLAAKVADAYFLAGDYELAAGSYAQALQKRSAVGEMWPTLQYQRILSLLRADAIDQAIAAIKDYPDGWAGEAEELRWRLEWNVAVQLSRGGNREDAQSRVERLLEEGGLPESLGSRFEWLNVRLLFDLGRYESVIARADRVLGGANAESAFGPEVSAELMLVRSRAELRTGEDVDVVIAELESIRTQFPETEAAPETLWIASRMLSQQGRLIDAEEAMNQLAAEYAGTQWSRMALFESADLAEAREDFEQAASRLEDFVQESPQDPLAFTARLNQADLLRKTGDFDEARVLLDSVLQAFPGHPERFLAEMIRADILAAGSGENRLESAISAYGRLLDLPGLPADLLLEARFKLGKVHERLGDKESAIREWLEAALKFEEATDGAFVNGPYWVSRSLLEIARISEEQQNIEAAKGALGRLIALGLPGTAAANSALQRLRSPLVGLNSVSP